ncbi:MAG: hypothetical protein ACPGU1_01780 [Myxococcota bacterium]
MRAVMCSVGLALVLTTACGGDADTAAEAESTDVSVASMADSVEAEPTTDVTTVADTEEGGSKGDVTPEPVDDDVASEDALLPESDVAAHDADTTQHDLDAASDDVAEAEDSGALDDVVPAEDTMMSVQDVAEADTATVADATLEEDTGSEADSGEDVEGEPDPCEACIASGGTWQPEADACTENCAIMDISCYTSSCPAPCSLESCGTCIGQEECEGMGCTWNAEPPAFWCN